MKRSLSLKREALAELTGEDLLGVHAAGADRISVPHPVCVLLEPSQMSCGFSCEITCRCEL